MITIEIIETEEELSEMMYSGQMRERQLAIEASAESTAMVRDMEYKRAKRSLDKIREEE